MSGFASTLAAWQRRRGRRGLPWQGTRDPYCVWLSEVMLQQTQVATVIPYYERFIARYPGFSELARASEDEVLRLWSGLGYYARGRNLLLAAQAIAARGEFPRTAAEICELPGVGRSTAAAIATFAFGERAAILDGNVKRVLARCFGVEGWPGAPAVERRLWSLAERLVPKRGVETYTQALMDLGAMVCTARQPKCEACPLRARCVARKQGRIDHIPARRARRALPQKSVTWLVLCRQGEILLEKRRSSGIWGGLWCFPQIEGADFDASLPGMLEPIEHGFTHFRLRILPLLCDVSQVAPRAESPGRLWLDLGEAAQAAVPAPVRTLLARLRAAGR